MRHGYTYGQVLERVKAKVLLEGFGDIKERRHKGVYEDARVTITRDQWNRKWKGAVEFTYEELDALADFFNAPHGWPFLDWHYADALAQANEERRSRASPAAQDTSQSPAPASPSGRPGKQRIPGGR